ncbi:M48 family metallopeptidase [Ruminococcus sp.]|uniref:M48 family metallopeptidase n=1 Tax=Ruminococcus sp. TaxID=41978 RepID=UPI0025F0EA66|nr:M48 family metallopeptidase [Ruminococcus sp.]MBQ8964972.1 M48 family metallopeptidase [Ruminococcus sp.]
MALNHDLFIHEADRTALNALKAIPGFTPLLRGFMKIWNERQFKLMNLSTFVRADESQMSKYHDMLIPICKRLDIPVPDLYVSLNPYPNAYTSGDNEPFIVMTSGLLNTVPEELIPTVLAHECGHIACHHVLYLTMGRLILSGALSVLDLSPLITQPVSMAFYYWMRCSEYSADRAAAVCDGSGSNTIELCMRLAGFDKNVPIAPNKEAFLRQAEEYYKMVDESAWNKVMEFMMFSRATHPLNALRAYQCNKWTSTTDFKRMVEYLDDLDKGQQSAYVPLNVALSSFLKRDAEAVANELREAGFTNIVTMRSAQERSGMPVNGIILITADGRTDIKMGEWLPAGIPWLITAYQPLSAAEEKAAHPGQACVPYSSVGYCGRDYRTVVDELRALGFTNISVCEQADIKVKFLIKEYSVAHISIDHVDRFDKNSWFSLKAPVSIRYHVMAQS